MRVHQKLWLGFLCLVMGPAFGARTVRADAFTDYALSGSFSLPAAGVFDVLGDGRLVSLHGADVYTETAVGSRTFTLLGTLPNADMPDPQFAGPAFVRISPDGTRLAVGNNGGSTWTNFQVGIFQLSGLTGEWFPVTHYDAEWIDHTNLALTAGPAGPPSLVTALDTSSSPANPTNPTLVNNIGGYSAGVAFDALGNLYTGNGFDAPGPSDTGWIKAFPEAAWQAALAGGPAIDFEAQGTLMVDLLSAGSLGFDAEGNLHVGGGDLLGGDNDYAGLVRHTAIADALGGGGAADPLDPTQVRRFDPDATSPGSFYDLNYNVVTGELYVRDGAAVYTYVVPEPSTLLLLMLAGLVGLRRRSGLRLAATAAR